MNIISASCFLMSMIVARPTPYSLFNSFSQSDLFFHQLLLASCHCCDYSSSWLSKFHWTVSTWNCACRDHKHTCLDLQGSNVHVLATCTSTNTILPLSQSTQNQVTSHSYTFSPVTGLASVLGCLCSSCKPTETVRATTVAMNVNLLQLCLPLKVVHYLVLL